MIVGSSSGVHTFTPVGTPSKKPRRPHSSNPSEAYYQRRLSLYSIPPTGALTIEEFEIFGLKRLKVLKALERKLSTTKLMDINLYEITKELPLPKPLRNPVDHQWLMQQEKNLLQLRLRELGAHQEFGDQNELGYKKVKLEQITPLMASLTRVFGSTFKPEILYKIPFTSVLDLVADRKVLLERGDAYVDGAFVESLILNSFKESLLMALEVAHRSFVSSSEDRIGPFVDRLPKQYLGDEFVPSKYGDEAVDLATLDQLSMDHFPLCMRKAHGHVKTHHHMRHLGRLQYGLFLKGIGLTLEQSLEFWHSEFVIKAGEDGWKKKNYAYNIQHNYGQQGRRQSYTPYNCQKILTLPHNPGDDHGCPYQTLSFSDLGAFLGDIREKNQVIRLCEDKRYTEACITFYKAKRGDTAGSQMLEPHTLHPNKYYIESRRDATLAASGIVTADSKSGTETSAVDTSMNVDQSDSLNSSFAHYDDLDLDDIVFPENKEQINGNGTLENKESVEKKEEEMKDEDAEDKTDDQSALTAVDEPDSKMETD